VSNKLKNGEYKPVAEQAREGIYELVDPLDYLLLDALPKQGTTMGGVVPLGESVRNLQATKFGMLDTGQISGRLVAMRAAGYCLPVRTASVKNDSGKAWQITPFGEKVLAEWKKNQSTSEEA
jgi:hypothetical protein